VLARAAVAAAVLVLSFAAYRLWKRPPRRLAGLSLRELGVRGPAIVQFSTRWCAPCKVAAPKLVEAARRAEVEYAEIDLEERPEVAARYGIRTVPTIAVTGRTGLVLRTWTKLPPDAEIAEVVRKASAA
jgi:thiol-disulfide isomerase/thioredoxin